MFYRQGFLVSEKLGLFYEILNILMSSNSITVEYFLLKFYKCYQLKNVYQRVFDILYRSVINKNVINLFSVSV